ncbi:MAG: ferredoxin [Hydrocarboniphaga sp.]|uniref:2Fe-2S iron-sulfur cluster-binding protein n=1 Tax=Hydrocarboniphaga sp. TaxID=2033016 RepID=UPI0026196816|nr:2Fe-2S iron-sulfur cluster-binding protein [Hydrocarboniphaga sp.]MDB5971389.1 ferredoxin [Hydrocarboniphaga sp.]
MLTVNFILADGSRRAVQIAPGRTVKEAAEDNLIRGILALCGGSCTCGTCHVYVGEQWAARFAPPSIDEDALLDGAAAERRDTSRLSCQLPLAEDMDGIMVTVPDQQQ